MTVKFYLGKDCLLQWQAVLLVQSSDWSTFPVFVCICSMVSPEIVVLLTQQLIEWYIVTGEIGHMANLVLVCQIGNLILCFVERQQLWGKCLWIFTHQLLASFQESTWLLVVSVPRLLRFLFRCYPGSTCQYSNFGCSYTEVEMRCCYFTMWLN